MKRDKDEMFWTLAGTAIVLLLLGSSLAMVNPYFLLLVLAGLAVFAVAVTFFV